MKKFKISATAKPRIVQVGSGEDEIGSDHRSELKAVNEIPIDFLNEDADIERVDPITELQNSVKGGLVFLTGAKPQEITGKSQLMQEMVAAAEAKKKEATKPNQSGRLVFVTPKYEEQLRSSGRSVISTSANILEVPIDVPSSEYDPKVEIKEENPLVDLKTELEDKIRMARERYFMRNRSVNIEEQQQQQSTP